MKRISVFFTSIIVFFCLFSCDSYLNPFIVSVINSRKQADVNVTPADSGVRISCELAGMMLVFPPFTATVPSGSHLLIDVDGLSLTSLWESGGSTQARAGAPRNDGSGFDLDPPNPGAYSVTVFLTAAPGIIYSGSFTVVIE
jgi:hypothetical protein